MLSKYAGSEIVIKLDNSDRACNVCVGCDVDNIALV